ncbi:hypothetical protein P691DRAFT_649684, partial [Macrolepiota fuliginosa MF-IS2]
PHGFAALCAWLGMTADAAYSALHHLHSVVDIPPLHHAYSRNLSHLHKSFSNYLCDFERSHIFPDYASQRVKLSARWAQRVFDE